jgi:hypothetical protein
LAGANLRWRVDAGILEQVATYSIHCSDSLTPVKFDSMGASIEAACRMIQGGQIVLQVVGSDGFLMERADIEEECSRRARMRDRLRPSVTA